MFRLFSKPAQPRYWGDGFDFDMLHKAQQMICKLSPILGLNPIMKEKYGTIRFEMLFLWKFSEKYPIFLLQKYGFYGIVYLTAIRYWKVRAEILDEIDWIF